MMFKVCSETVSSDNKFTMHIFAPRCVSPYFLFLVIYIFFRNILLQTAFCYRFVPSLMKKKISPHLFQRLRTLTCDYSMWLRDIFICICGWDYLECNVEGVLPLVVAAYRENDSISNAGTQSALSKSFMFLCTLKETIYICSCYIFQKQRSTS